MSQAAVVEAFEFNGLFRIVAGEGHFTTDLDLDFRAPACPYKRDYFYRTKYGYGVGHTAVVYGNTPENLALALRRLTGCRRAEKPGEDARLRARTEHFFHTLMPQLLRILKDKYAPYFAEYRGMREEARLHHADPHPKRELRIRAWRELQESGRDANRFWGRPSRHGCIGEGKMKREEYAKPGKKPRLIVDVGVAASLQGFRLTEMLKTAQSEEACYFSHGEAVFVKSPTDEVMERVFENLLEPKGAFYACYFSDDMCIAIRDGTRVLWFNVDISSCDASHTPAVFQAFVDLFPPHCQHDAQILVDQCTWAIKIRNPYHMKEYVVLKPRVPRLYSGVTITTGINNVASLGLTAAIVWSGAKTAAQVVRACERIGYLVTVEECQRFEELQFLKHSPIRDTKGIYRPLLNIGVALRLSGACKNDLPNRGDLRLRARCFQTALLEAIYPSANFAWLEQMRLKAGDGWSTEEARDKVAKMLQYKYYYSTPRTFLDCDVLRRYFADVKPWHVQEWHDLTRTGYGEVVYNSTLGAILLRDYGLPLHSPRANPPAMDLPCHRQVLHYGEVSAPIT